MKQKTSKNKFLKFITLFTFVVLLGFVFTRCQNEPIEAAAAPDNYLNDFKSKIVSLKDLPKINVFVKEKTSNFTSRDAKRGTFSDIIYDENNVIEIVDRDKITNYSFRFVFEDTPKNIHYSFVVNVLPSGKKEAYVMKYVSNIADFESYKNHNYDFKYFKGTIALHKSTDYFEDLSFSKKDGVKNCPPKVDEYGDPIPINVLGVGGGGSITGGGSANVGGAPAGTGSGGFYGASPSNTGGPSSNGPGNSGNGNGCCSCGNCGIHYYPPKEEPNHQTPRLGYDADCPKNNPPGGIIGITGAPSNLLALKDKLTLSGREFSWLKANPQVTKSITEYLSLNDTREGKTFAIEAINFLLENPTIDWEQFSTFYIKVRKWTFNSDDGTTFIDSNPSKQPEFRFDPSDNYETKYPKFTNLVKNLKTFVKSNPKVLNALQAYSGFSKQQILDYLQFGKGPVIKIEEMTGKYGFFGPYSKVLNIRASYVRGLEQASYQSTQEATAFLLAVTILHEFVHFGTDSNKITSDGLYEFGSGFERDAFNVIINKDNAGKIVISFTKYF
jgi:hypothetical protein